MLVLYFFTECEILFHGTKVGCRCSVTRNVCLILIYITESFYNSLSTDPVLKGYFNLDSPLNLNLKNYVTMKLDILVFNYLQQDNQLKKKIFEKIG